MNDPAAEGKVDRIATRRTAELPQLDDKGREKIENAKQLARQTLGHADIHLDRATKAGPTRSGFSSRASTGREATAVEEHREQCLHQARGCARIATTQLFDVYAAQYWRFVNSNLRAFLELLPALCDEVEEGIHRPDLSKSIREAIRQKRIELTERVSHETEERGIRFQYAEEMHRILADFRRQFAREPSRRTDALESLARDLVEVHLGRVLSQVTNGSEYEEFINKARVASAFICDRVSTELSEEDFVTVREFVHSECERFQGKAAGRARTGGIEEAGGITHEADAAEPKGNDPPTAVRQESSASEKQSRKAKKLVRRNQSYRVIDRALKEIAESRPNTQIEVFQWLDGRHVVIPLAEPFMAARGWMAGFQRDAPAARTWLSKRWAELNLLRLPRGPKNPKK